MLQQTPSLPSALAGEVPKPVRPRPLGVLLLGGVQPDRRRLPASKNQRNYLCEKCKFYTTSARQFLWHSRDVHFEKLKIYECTQCNYACRNFKKLVRHMKVHSKMDTEDRDSIERIEDFLEEVEEDDDEENMELEECEESPERERSGAGAGADDTDEPVPVPSVSRNNVPYYSCSKCNYVTHIRGRYTKHVKYHSMPMIKCNICEFRTPYKWNLDRHNKNHGGTGSFHCSMCNFTADIKQSLTVHEMNHHSAATGQSGAIRRRNRVGASDCELAAPAPAPAAPAPALRLKEEEGSGDSRSSHSPSDMGLQSTDKDIISCNSDSNDATASDAAAKRDDFHLAQDAQNRHSPNITSEDGKCQKQRKRPPPPLIPLNTSTPNQSKTSEPPAKKLKENMFTNTVDSKPEIKYENIPADITLVPVNPSNGKDLPVRKKNHSFFDKLKERLLTETGEDGSLTCKNCGFESKCLSEHSVHEKNCTPLSSRIANTSVSSLGSTRCQNCRHRCKSSADLYIHMQTCVKEEKMEDDELKDIKSERSDETDSIKQEKDSEPHPMENVVFVWNNINQEPNKFELPLEINISDETALHEQRSYEPELGDDNDSMNLSPSQAAGKKVFKCPHCPFWASTASRFHVHIVGHLNKKPFECSLCKYKSNWRWDITKHIKLKSVRDPEHNDAKVLMTDETGRRNYSKYNKFLAHPVFSADGIHDFTYLDPNALHDPDLDADDMFNDDSAQSASDMQPLNLQTQYSEHKYDDGRPDDPKRPKKTMWKCKKCNFKDPSKEALLEHVREHSKSDGNSDDKKKAENVPDPADLAYRCGHCNQLSNWKHVIQRHCRLKHDGIVKVITTVRPKPDLQPQPIEASPDACPKCPYKSADPAALFAHLQQHTPSPLSIFKCYFCAFFVKAEEELIQHLVLHGVSDPEEYIAKVADGKYFHDDGSTKTKRHKCTDCPYETNSKSQYQYHEQFHRLPADTPYKCPECNYSVSKRHLLHQHLRVHGIFPKKSEMEAELEASSSSKEKTDFPVLDEIPFVWVSAKNEFHKMYKCRYCSYVNSQKCKIPNHEKIHCVYYESTDVTIYKCLECKFTYDNAGRLAEHSKAHAEIYGRIYCPVEEDVPDEEQIAKLRKVLENEKSSTTESIETPEVLPESKEVKVLNFCHKCPARFFTDLELKMHDRYHDLSYEYKCKHCEFSVSVETDLTSHLFVHSDEYHTKTKMLKFVHGTNPLHKQPMLELVHCQTTSDVSWVVSNPSKNYEEITLKKPESCRNGKQYNCKECPAKFFKTSALNYHVGLHGGDGEHKCKKCTYAVKNVGNLAKHEALHDNEGKTNCEYDSADDADYKNIPLSGTDLFQRKTEAQKRVLTDKDKLVKPNDHFPPVLQADPQFGYLMHGNPEFIYPTYLKNGRQKEKRYKCHKCPSAFEKREQYKIHLSLHGSKQRYKCELCDYSVKYYANYVQHMRKHQMNDEAQAERKKGSSDSVETEIRPDKPDNTPENNIKLAIKTMPKGVVRSDFQSFSISDQQTLRLLQRRRSMNAGKEGSTTEPSPNKDRKLHMCVLCPYTNQRQDALSNHYRRHDDTDHFLYTGSHKCAYCDLVVVQSHFLRDHLKTHFSYHKNLNPECFAANEDVSFTITKVDEEKSTDLKLDVKTENYSCNEDKIFVNIKTGELLVE